MKISTFICLIIIFFSAVCFCQDINNIGHPNSQKQSDSDDLQVKRRDDYVKMSLLLEVTEQPWRHPERVKYLWMRNIYIGMIGLFLIALRPRINKYIHCGGKVKIIEL
ncbi:MAG: hypothetical protein ABRQ38_14420 [Candidatus Eremiobacterota bacterium]